MNNFRTWQALIRIAHYSLYPWNLTHFTEPLPVLTCTFRLSKLPPFLLSVSIVCRPEAFVVHPHHMSASSSQGWHLAQYGLITEDVLTAWCAAEKDTRQWLQIDLQENKDLLALALQGFYGHSWVESFYLQYSVDEETWYCYGSEKGHKVLTTINGVDCRNL